MKRLLGLTGITYLSVLVIVFYFSSPLLILSVAVTSTIMLLTGIFFKIIKKRRKLRNLMIAVGITSLSAVLSIILYSNIVYNPVIEQYSYKEIKISGYLCEEVQKYDRSCKYIIRTDEVDGKSENLKIQLTSYVDLNIEEFERVKATVTVRPVSMNYLLSKGIFLEAFAGEDFSPERTGEKEISLYNIAINVRKSMKQSLDTLLPNTQSSLCKAVLLGDKQALSYEVKSYFTKTGTSFLIVVSGLHLSIIVSAMLILLKKITHNRIIIFICVLITVFSFMSITGFASSVVRSGVMTIMTFCAPIFFRKSDPLNSLGLAGIVLTVLNPYSVGDIGMLLSFMATIGIVLWSKPINSFIDMKLHIKNKLLKYCTNMISVSISASLWILPISVIAFGRVSPFVVVVSFFTSPIISVILILALIASLLYIIPFISFMAYPFALVAGLLCNLQIWIISAFASIPFSSVNAEAPYFYIWIALTVLLVVIGYLVKAKSFYIKSAIAVSFSTLLLCWAVYAIIGYNTTTINIYNTDYGVTATVECGGSVSLVSCGGAVQSESDIIRELSDNYFYIDNIIIPQQKYRYSRYLYSILSEFDVSNILVYDNKSQTRYEKYDGYQRNIFSDNTSFTINLNPNTADEIININGVTYQYIKSNDKTILFTVVGADIAKLPEKYRKADYLIIDSLPENYSLLSCEDVIFCGDEEYYIKHQNSIKEISNSVKTTLNCNVKLVF